MAVTLHKPDAESVRYKVMRDIIKFWLEYNPREARDCADAIRMLYKNQLSHKTGKWREGGDGYFRVAFPQELMLRCRLVFKKVLPDEPPFGHDDDDILFMMKEFPDLVAGTIDKPRPKKDFRKKTKIWSSDEPVSQT